VSITLLLIIIIISYCIVRSSAIALEMTGISIPIARFQALSAFTGTGFTTQESERIVNHPVRRKIVSFLMILGNAGIVSIIGAFIFSFGETGSFNPLLTLIIIIVALVGLYNVAEHRTVDTKLSETIRQNLRTRLHIEKVLIEEIIHQPEGYGVASVIIAKDSKIAQLTLEDLGLKDSKIIVLSIERDGSTIPQPVSKTQIKEDDRLICFGKLDLIRQLAN
jgi:hypothetical protein